MTIKATNSITLLHLFYAAYKRAGIDVTWEAIKTKSDRIVYVVKEKVKV